MVFIKKLVVFSMTLALFLALTAPTASAQLGESHPGSGNSNELTGPKKTEIVRISNAELRNAGNTALAAERLLLASIPYTAIIGIGGAASILAGSLNQGTGYEVTLHLQYGTKKVFDGQWVEHTGWHLTGQSISTY